MTDLGDNWPFITVGILGLMVVTFISRSGFYLLPDRMQLPVWAERLLRYAPGCALAAIVAPGVLAPQGDVYLGWSNHAIWAALASAALFVRWRNMLAMITVGMLVFTALRLWA